jgi:hypothetical protein
MRFVIALLVSLVAIVAMAQEPTDPAFEPPFSPSGSEGGHVRFNGAIGMVVINGKVYQQFALRPDVPIGKFGVGLDLTFRFDQDGNFKDDEWRTGKDYLQKIYYVRYGLPGDPFYARVGALDNVTLGYGIIMKRYSNTIQYPDIKRIGIYTEGQYGRVGWQAMTNNITELDQPGILAARLSYETKLAGLTFGATVAHDGNMFAGLKDTDHDGVPDALDLFPGQNEFAIRDRLIQQFQSDTALRDWLIDNHYLPDFRRAPVNYRGLRESVTEVGADVGLPLVHGSKFSLWTYAQAAKIVDFGYGWAFPGARAQLGPLEISAEYRQYEKEFLGQFFNFSYEIERAQLKNDTFVTKEKTLKGLGRANGWYGDAMLSIGSFGYAYAWYQDMHGQHYLEGKSLYGEAGVTPPPVTRLQKVAGYYMQPDVNQVLKHTTDGTIYGGKVYVSLAQKVSLVYDHRITYFNGKANRTIRVETMMSF